MTLAEATTVGTRGTLVELTVASHVYRDVELFVELRHDEGRS